MFAKLTMAHRHPAVEKVALTLAKHSTTEEERLINVTAQLALHKAPLDLCDAEYLLLVEMGCTFNDSITPALLACILERTNCSIPQLSTLAPALLHTGSFLIHGCGCF